MEVAELTRNQLAVLSHAASADTSCFAGGAIRSGKTTAAMLGFALWTLREGMDHHHAVIGYSLETVMRNVGWPLLDIFESYGVRARLTRDLGTRIVVPFEGRSAHVWIIGCNDERASVGYRERRSKGCSSTKPCSFSSLFQRRVGPAVRLRREAVGTYTRTIRGTGSSGRCSTGPKTSAAAFWTSGCATTLRSRTK